MKNSKFNIPFTIGDERFVYNTLSTSIISLDEETRMCLETGTYNKLPQDVITVLKQNGFIVDKETDETKIYNYYYETTRFADSLNKLDLIILPTYFCNLSCTYCIQDCYKENSKIQKKGINSIIRFAEMQLAQSSITRVMFSLYGGEPLLAKKECIELTDRIRKLTEKYSTPLDTYIVTNGTLIDQEVIDRLFIPNKMYMQISIDGLKESHNRKRTYKNHNGTYDKITQNLENLLTNGLKEFVTLRINIDQENISEAERIIETFRPYSDDIYFGLLTPQGHNINNAQNCISSKDCASKHDYEFTQALKRYGINPIGSKFGKKMPCADNSENKYMIDPYLDIYKCDLLLGKKEYRVGFLNETGKLNLLPQFYEQMTRTPFNFIECTNCILLPSCAGGCAAKAAIEKGSFNKPYCEITKEELVDYIKNFVFTTEV